MNRNTNIVLAAVAGVIILSGAAVAAWYFFTRNNPAPQNQVKQIAGKVSVYFPNTKKDPDMLDCSKVYVVERPVALGDDQGVVAMHELLKGPTDDEKSQGYITSLPTEVNDPEITIGRGAVIANFDMTLEKGMGGSCRVSSVRSQLEHTLKAVYPDHDVVLSVDGRTEDILQP